MFDDTARFPTSVSYGGRGGPGFKTAVVELDSGSEQRVSRHSLPRHRYQVPLSAKALTDLHAVKKLHVAMRGAECGFRFKDWLDYASTADGRVVEADGWGAANPANTNEATVPIAGSTVDFQLAKRYSYGALTRVRPITRPIANTVVVAVSGVAQVGNWSVDQTTGILTMNSTPAATPTAGFQFDVPARFGLVTDDLLEASIDSFGDGSITVEILELKEGGGIEDEYFYGGAREVAFTADFTLSHSLGRTWVLNATNAGRSVRLPDPATLPPGGEYFHLINGGANSIALKDHANAALVPAMSLAAGEFATVVLSVDSLGNKVWYAA